MKLKSDAKSWTIRYTRPKVFSYSNSVPRIVECNHCSIVIAPDVVSACNALRKQFSDSTFVSINPGPIGDVIVSMDAVDFETA